MPTRKTRVRHMRSNQLVGNVPKLPEPGIIDYGEIAVNYAEGHEVLTIKNSANELVTFISSNAIQTELDKKANKTEVYSKTDADSTFLKITTAASTYLSKSDASNIFLNKEDASDEYATKTELATKQDKLVSGTNIRTINGTPVLGEGNIELSFPEPPNDGNSYGRKFQAWERIVMPDVSEFITGSQADAKYQPIGSYLTSVPAEYVTESELNSKGYQTASQVSAAIADLVDSAPAALDTLNELAAALGDDPNFATTITQQLANKSDVGHTHTVANITNFPSTWSWNSISGKPSSFTPSSHTHAISEVTGLQSALDGKAASSHTHAITAITGRGTLTFNGAATGEYDGSGDLTITIPQGGGTADSVAWGNVTGKPGWVDSSSKPSYNWGEIGQKPSTFTPSSHTHSAADITSGTINIARIPTGTSSSTVALGNHTHSQYLTSSSLAGYATESYVTDAINDAKLEAGGGISAISQNTSGSGTGRLVTSVSGSTVYVRNMSSSDVTTALGYTPVRESELSDYATVTYVSQQIGNVTDTKNTAGSTNSSSKLFLIGATSQTSSSVTYSESGCYISGGELYSNGAVVATQSYVTGRGYATQSWVSGSYATRSYVDEQIAGVSGDVDLSNYVTLNTTQTITGTKTFTQYTVFSNGAGTSSDIRLKENLKEIDSKDSLEKINSIHSFEYDLKSNGNHTSGLIAQDIESIVPEAVITDEEGFKSVDTYPIIAHLIGAVNQLTAEVEALKAEIVELKNK